MEQLKKEDLYKEYLYQQRALLIHDFDKVKPENRNRYDKIQSELLKLEDEECCS